MTGPLAAAQHLQSLDAERLRAALNVWRPAFLGSKPDLLTRVEDVFDLIELLHQPDRVQRLLPQLAAPVIAALTGDAGANADTEAAIAALLLDPATLEPYPAVATALEQTLRDEIALVASTSIAGTGSTASSPASSQAAATIVRDIVVLAASLSQLAPKQPVDPTRQLKRNDQQRLAEILHRDLEITEPMLRLAVAAELAALRHDVWRPRHAHIAAFAAAAPAERWLRLAAAWLDQFPADVASLALGPADTEAGSSWMAPTTAAMLRRYPLGRSWIAPMLERAGVEAAVLGLVAEDRVTELGQRAGALFRASRGAEASTEQQAVLEVLARTLPAEVDKVYLQHDLSVIAPGPLRADLDLQLRQFAEPEGHGPASAYRMSAATMHNALRAGVTAAQMRELLVQISAGPIPQPLEYILADLNEGSVIEVRDLHGVTSKTELFVADPQRAAELLVDTSLRSLRLQRTEDVGRLRSVVAPEVVLNSLHAARYPARSAVSAPEAPRAVTDSVPQPDPIGAALDALAERVAQHGGLGSEPSEAWHTRQLQEAIRNRTPVELVLAMPDGTDLTMRLTPAAVHNGRLRGRDLASESERTLPVKLVRSITILDTPAG